MINFKINKTSCSWPFLSLLVGGLALLLQHCSPALVGFLEYHRSLVLEHQLWRIFTAHLVHWNFNHFIWDWMAFIALASAYECLSENPQRRAVLAFSLLSGSILISLSVFLLLPEMLLYRGLSGLCVTVFTLFMADLLLTSLKNNNQGMTITLLLTFLGLIVKTAYEVITGNTLFVSSNGVFTVVPLAHFTGAMAAVLSLGWYYSKSFLLVRCRTR